MKPLSLAKNGTEETLNLKWRDLSHPENRFYTDASGMFMQERVRDFRFNFDWKQPLDDPVSGNYYPVTSAIAFEDPKRNIKVSVSTDRSQGATVLPNGHIQMLIHRRLFYDDGRGVA